MDAFTLGLIAAASAVLFNAYQQRQRIVLLATQLAPFRIEKLMESVTQGYLRALGESEEARRDQIWGLLQEQEGQLASQFQQFATAFGRLPENETRVSRLPLALPLADRLLPGATFDMRRALAIHAEGIARVARNEAGLPPRDKAYRLSAELFLMQHTCHWFCKSRAVASARVVARHQTPYAQIIASVSPETRAAYLALVKG